MLSPKSRNWSYGPCERICRKYSAAKKVQFRYASIIPTSLSIGGNITKTAGTGLSTRVLMIALRSGKLKAGPGQGYRLCVFYATLG